MSGVILVTGATGNVGSEVVAELLRAGRSVRVAVPGCELEVARERWGGAVEVVSFNFEEPDTFYLAFAGVDGVFLMRPPHISNVRRIMGPAIRHATGHGRPHVVVLSVLGAGNNPLVPHHAMEKLVKRSGLPYTLVRPSFFMQNLSTQYREDIGTRSKIHVPAGRGKTSFIDVRDIAAVAARVMGRAEHFGRAYTLTGGEALDYFQVARVLTEVLGRPVRYTNPSPREFRARLREQGAAEDFIRVLRGIYFTARIGLAARLTPDVEQLLGRLPIPLERFVRDHAGLWDDDRASLHPLNRRNDHVNNGSGPRPSLGAGARGPIALEDGPGGGGTGCSGQRVGLCARAGHRPPHRVVAFHATHDVGNLGPPYPPRRLLIPDQQLDLVAFLQKLAHHWLSQCTGAASDGDGDTVHQPPAFPRSCVEMIRKKNPRVLSTARTP
jgi:uncharacterized protein YbjT (DUF2867 family)